MSDPKKLWIKILNKHPIYSFIIFLILLNLVAHFLPFERGALAPDDYAILVKAQRMNITEILSTFMRQPDRPLNFLVVLLQAKLTDLDARIGLILVFISSTFLLLTVFFLLLQLFNQRFLAGLGAIVFCLLPNKLELYHTPIFFNINLAITIYVLSFIFFIRYIRVQKRVYFMLSIFSYTVGIFWYEVGFFLPLILVVYTYFHDKQRLTSTIWFLVPSVFYSFFRITEVFGWADIQIGTRAINLFGVPQNFIEILKHYFGRYIIRSIVYGTYKFISMEPFWLLPIILANLILLTSIFLWIRKKDIEHIDSKLLYLAGTIFIAFFIPNLLHGVGGRHTALPSIGVIILLLWALGLAKNHWRGLVMAGVFFSLIVCQGTAWSQVIACRINRAIFDHMERRKVELQMADRILIDTRSFADNIPYTWVENKYNVLNTYYGVQALEDWGLRSMARLVTNDYKKPILVAVSNLKHVENNRLEFLVVTYANDPSVPVHKMEIVPQEGTAIVDFASVFGENACLK